MASRMPTNSFRPTISLTTVRRLRQTGASRQYGTIMGNKNGALQFSSQNDLVTPK